MATVTEKPKHSRNAATAYAIEKSQMLLKEHVCKECHHKFVLAHEDTGECSSRPISGKKMYKTTLVITCPSCGFKRRTEKDVWFFEIEEKNKVTLWQKLKGWFL